MDDPMKKIRWDMPGILLGGLSAAIIFSAAAMAQDLDEILARYYQARGGMDRLLAVNSIRYSGFMTVGTEMNAPMSVEQKRPNFMRLEFTLQGLTAVQAYDGKTGWIVMPFMGRTEPKLMSSEELQAAIEQADFDGPLVNYRQKGHRIELTGKETIDGKAAYKLKVSLKGAGTYHLYLDASSFLPFKEIRRRTYQEMEREMQTVIGDYRTVSGLVIAHSTETSARGTAFRQKVVITRVEINPTLPNSLFAIPRATATPSPKASPKTP
jgi:hypothetical protein